MDDVGLAPEVIGRQGYVIVKQDFWCLKGEAWARLHFIVEVGVTALHHADWRHHSASRAVLLELTYGGHGLGSVRAHHALPLSWAHCRAVRVAIGARWQGIHGAYIKTQWGHGAANI